MRFFSIIYLLIEFVLPFCKKITVYSRLKVTGLRSRFYTYTAVVLFSSAILASISLAGQPSNNSADSSNVQSPRPDTTNSSLPFPQNPDGKPLWYSMVTNVPGDWVKYYNITFRSDKIGEYSAIAAMTGILMATDNQT